MKGKLLLFLFSALLIFSACEKEKDPSYGQYPVSWLPLTDLNGESNFEVTYADGSTIDMLLRFKNFSGNEISAVKLYQNEVNDAGAYENTELVADYTQFDYEEATNQHVVKMSFSVPKSLIDKKIALTAVLESRNDIVQEREILNFSVLEAFDATVKGIPYFWMYDNTYEDASMGYTVEHSAGYTVLTSVMNYFDFDETNANYIGELGANLNAHTPDWVASYYVSIWPKIIANNVNDLARVYYNEAPYYGAYSDDNYNKTGSEGTYAMIEEEVMAGRPVIVHGDFRGDSDFKHQIAIVGYNDDNYLVVDPCGKWDGNVNGDYVKTAEAGNYVKYSKASVQAAIGADGAFDINVFVDLRPTE